MLSFDAFETEELILYIFNFPETESFNQIFEEAGMEGTNFFALIGPLFMMMLIYTVYMIIQLMLRYVYWDQEANKCIMKIVRNKYHSVIITRFILESCIELLISACIAIYAQAQNVGTVQEVISVISAYLCGMGLILVPVYLYFVHEKFINNYED